VCFQELRRRQVELSRKQVELLSSKKSKGRFGAATGQQGLDSLTTEMQNLCGLIEAVERMTVGTNNEEEKHEDTPAAETAAKDSDDE
jgi:hypothetical protein